VPEVSENWREVWEERVAIMVADGTLPRVEAERLAWEGLPHSAAAGGMPYDKV
jgi:thioester reductase-like protein